MGSVTPIESIKVPSSHELPFVQTTASATNFWNVKRTNSYEQDCAAGRAHAVALLAYMRNHNDPVILGSVIRAIVAGGVYEGVEIGFCGRIGVELTSLF